MLDGDDLFDFADELEQHRDLIATVAGLCTQVLGSDVELNTEMVEWVVELLYGRPSLSQLARRILVKGCAGREQEVGAEWAGAAMKMVAEKKVHAELWRVLWRDVALMRSDVRDQIIEGLWQDAEHVDGIFPVLAAFFSE
jgi:hypothetical protein